MAVAPQEAQKKDDKKDDQEDEDKVNPKQKLTHDIREHMERITAAGSTFYDGKMLNLTYRNTMAVERDAEFYGKNKAKHTVFSPPHIRLSPRIGIPTFGANTYGSFHLRPRVKGNIEVQAKVLYQLADKNAYSFMLVHSSGKEFLAGNFGVHIMHKSKKKRRPKIYPCSQYSTDPQYWVDRTAAKYLKIKYDADAKEMVVYQNDAKMNSRVIADAPEGGQVGFSWKGAKFIYMEIKIKGELDREWAVKVIKEPRPDE